MVWIHGGGFFSGTGNSKLFKPTYLLDHNVVLVTLNYRLGPLGEEHNSRLLQTAVISDFICLSVKNIY
jgi:carboxylesterase type B